MTSEEPPADPSLTVAAVARRLGVAPATLRTWDRRYGLGPSEHLAGSHRRYSAADVARLLTMRRLTLEGVAPSEAARAARATGPTAGPSTLEVLDAYSDAVPMVPDPVALAAAAGHFDNAAVRWVLTRVHPRDVLAWWTELVEPALTMLKERPVVERPGESAVRVLEAAAFAELRSRAAVRGLRARGLAGGDGRDGDGAWAREATAATQLAEAQSPDDGASDGVQQPAGLLRGGVLAVPTGSAPDLLVHVLATALHDRGLATGVLAGGRAAALGDAVTELAPAAVLLHVGRSAGDAAHGAEVVRVIGVRSPGLPVFVHMEGSGALDVPPSASVSRVRTLPGALHEILAVVS